MDAQRVHLDRDARPIDRDDAAGGKVQRLRDHRAGVHVKGPGLAAGDQLPGPQVPAVGEPLRYHRDAVNGAETRQLPTGLRQQRHAVPEGVLGADDCVGHDVRGDGVADRLVVEGSVGLDMGQGGAVTLSLPRHHEDLFDQVAHQVRARRHIVAQQVQVRGPAESDPVPVRGMGPDGHLPTGGRRNGSRQHRSPTGVRASGDVGRRHDLQQGRVITDALPEVGVQVDPRGFHALRPPTAGWSGRRPRRQRSRVPSSSAPLSAVGPSMAGCRGAVNATARRAPRATRASALPPSSRPSS